LVGQAAAFGVGEELVSAGGGMEFGERGVHVRILSAGYRLVREWIGDEGRWPPPVVCHACWPAPEELSTSARQASMRAMIRSQRETVMLMVLHLR
jgi:hypothetical protein